MAQERLDIVIREDGARVARRNIEDVGAGAASAAKSVDKLKSLLMAVATGAVVNKLRQYADEYTNLQNRLRTVSTDQANLNALFAAMQGVSTRTRSSLSANIELYSKLSANSKELGLSQKDVIQFTTSLNQAIKLSGASAQEAESGVRQLGQAMASGALRGDELNSIMENLPGVADVIAKGMGVTRGELRKLGAEGKISAQEILKAFEKARVELDQNFGKTVPTMAEGFQLLNNQILETVGALDQASGSSNFAGGALQFITNAVRDITPELVKFTHALFGTLDPADELSDWTKIFATGLTVVYAVLKSVADFAGTVFIQSLRNAGQLIRGLSEAFSYIMSGDFAMAATIMRDTLSMAIGDAVDSMSGSFDRAVQNAADSMTKIDQIFNKGARQTQDRSATAVGAVGTASGPAAAAPVNPKEVAKAEKELRKLLNTIAPVNGAILEMAHGQKVLDEAFAKGSEEHSKYSTLLAEHYRDAVDPLSAVNRELELQAKYLSMTASARDIETQSEQIRQELLSKGIRLDQNQTSALRERLVALQELQKQSAVRDQLQASSGATQQQDVSRQLGGIGQISNAGDKSIATADVARNAGLNIEGTTLAVDAELAQFQRMYDTIDTLRQKDAINEQTAQQLRSNLRRQANQVGLAQASDFFGNMSSLSESGNKKLAMIGKAAAITQATIQGFVAVQNALAVQPYPVGMALAVSAGIAAAANVAKIAGVGFMTGGEFTVGGSGGADSQMVAFRASPGEKVAVQTPTQYRKGDPNAQGGQGGQGGQGEGQGIRIVNVVDPRMVGDFLSSSSGEKVLMNVIQKNAGTIKSITR